MLKKSNHPSQIYKTPQLRSVEIIETPEPNIFEYEKEGKFIQTQLLRIVIIKEDDLVMFQAKDGHQAFISYSTFEKMQNMEWKPGDPEFKSIPFDDN